MFKSRFMPCPECGASVDRSTGRLHECARDRWVDHQMSALRHEIDALEPAIRRYLSTAPGRFETWLAARTVRGRR
jgi:hypothetical protein